MACPLTPMGANVIVTMEDTGAGKEKKTDSGILYARRAEATHFLTDALTIH